jgi:hypothetical protein
MNRAIVVGAYEFLGFHLAMNLLELGFEVTGIDLGSQEEEGSTEEKKLMVGRNANFDEYSAADWKENGSIEEPHIIFVSLYDYYYSGKPDLFSWEGLFGHLNGALKATGSKPVFLLPVQYYENEREGIFHPYCEPGPLEIYLPTLFGRWQPSAFAFQQAIEGKENPYKASLEHKEDAIHAVEAAACIIEEAGKKEAGQLLFWSGEEGRWSKCALHLGMKVPDAIRPRILPAIEKRIIREENSFQTVLDKQMVYGKTGANPSGQLD